MSTQEEMVKEARPAATLGGSVSANHGTYSSDAVVKSYRKFQELFPAEKKIFERYAQQFSGSVLDVAIGAGRTTRELLPRSARYVGLDFAAGMVNACRQEFPSAELYRMDMRDVPAKFADRRFDAILISFNGIDYISWEDRCALLEGLRALLSPGAVLVFSSHDLGDVDAQRGFHIREDLRPSIRALLRNPAAFAWRCVKLPIWVARAWPNYRRNRALEGQFDGYAYVNDIAEAYGCVTTYVSVQRQTEFLRASGYRSVEVWQPWLKSEPAVFQYFSCTV